MLIIYDDDEQSFRMEEEMRLLVRGGSIPAAYGVKKGYVDMLRDRHDLKRLEIINRSRFRETSFDAIATYNEDVIPIRPQAILLHFGVDDAFAGVYRSEFQENMVQFIRLARAQFNPVFFLATAQTFDDPQEMEAVDIFYRSLRIVATDLSCHLIGVHTYWAGYLTTHHLRSKNLTLPDARYPNEKGHEVMAEVMGRWLSHFLTREIARPPEA